MFRKYSNFLTMLLVILIVAIIGVIAYFAYSSFNAKSINDTAQATLAELEKATTKVKKPNSSQATNTVSNTVESNALDELTALNTVIEEPVEQPEEESGVRQEPEKVFMEDYEVRGKIEIPKTKVEYPVLSSVTKRSLEIAVGIAYGPGLNEVGNTVIFGHNYRNGLFFSNNKKLAVGDKIYITDVYGDRVTYTIYKMYQTTANDATYMTRDTHGRREISLQTCTDDSSKRIIIWAAEGNEVVQE